MKRFRLLLIQLLMVAMATAEPMQLTHDAIERLIDMPSLNLLLNMSMKILPDLQINPDCRNHFIHYLDRLIVGREEWAVRMFDASTKIPDGVASGAFYHLGNFDQCLDVRGVNTDGDKLFRAQYCSTSYTISSGIAVTLAACIPGTCSPQDVQTILQESLDLLTPGFSVFINPENCYTGEDLLPVDAKAAVMISVFLIILVIVIAATAYDFYSTKSYSKASAALLSFSLKSNLPNLMSTKHARNSIKCITGIRALSLCWIMVGHRFSMNGTIPLTNTLTMFQDFSNPMYSVLSNAFLGVDTFFYLSGFLICYVFMADVTRSKTFNVFKFYIYRYIRLTTAYAMLLGFIVCLLRLIGYGPLWRSSMWQAKHCDKYWWLNIIYLNNYIRLDNDNFDPLHSDADCVDQGWYLTVDMQLSWFAPLVLVPLWRWPRYTTRIFLPLLTLASCFAPFTCTFINDFPMTMSLTGFPFDYRKYVVEMYWPAHMRATPYIGGIIAAYCMFKYRQIKIRLSKAWVVGGWAACTVISLLVVFGMSVMYDTNYHYDPVGAAFYSGFHRLAWAAALSWIVFACHNGYGGLVNSILSWKLLLPLSRLSYCMFLTHYILLYFDLGQVRTNQLYGQFSNTQDLLSDLLMVGVVLAMPLHLCVEVPTIKMLKIFLKSDSKIDPAPTAGEEKNKEMI